MAQKPNKKFIKTTKYMGTKQEMDLFVKQNMQYPKEAVENKIEGSVIVKFEINHKGKVFKTKVTKGIGHGCDEEAERIIKLMQFEPVSNRGVKSYFGKSLTINFRLPKAPKQSVQYHYTTTAKADKPKSKSYTIRINRK